MTRVPPIPTTTTEPTPEIDDRGTKRWKADGVLHREDGPAIETADGTRWWYRHDQRHREDGPAFEDADGTKAWYRHDQIHREDGPALEYSNGTKDWCLRGQYYTKPEWLREVLKDRPLTPHQRELLDALSENWEGIPELLYETVTHLAS